MIKWDVYLEAGEAEAIALVCAGTHELAVEEALRRAKAGEVCWEGTPSGTVLVPHVLNLGEDDA